MNVAHKQREQDKTAELHPFGKCPGDQRRRDHRKHHLEEHECMVRYGGRIIGIRFPSNPVEPEPFKPTDDAPYVRPKGERVTPQHPLDTDQSRG